ncbi:PKD domain-containing protein [Kutzneria sp. NPDC052558]|uniref:PKD domain-containing protein n=1 Tax=Kutzneria sp. NPDC052558 TaxID=3364121 RepID=UPI0037CC4753
MTLSVRRLCLPVLGFVAAVTVLLTPGVANAATPSNDDFDSATAVTALPFTSAQDNTQATTAADDPTSCYPSIRASVWYDYTPAADGIVLATVASSGSTPLIAAYTGTRGALTPVPGACTNFNTGSSATFHVTAGTTYHIMLLFPYYGTQVSFGLATVAPSPNDDFAAATVAGFPSEQSGDLARASAEPGEPTPSCDATADHSVWYRYTPDRTRSVSVEKVAYYVSPAITVYRGDQLGDLSEVDCAPSMSVANSVFTATAGQTYYIRLGASVLNTTRFDVRISTAPTLAPKVYAFPERPSVYNDVEFSTYAGDPLGRPLVTGEVSFGDGTSAPVTGDPIHHQYTKDGQYQVVLTGATADGRTGTGSLTVPVVTHDVSVSDFVVPASARVDQTKSISVSVADTRYDEDVSVELFRLSENGYYQSVGVLTQHVVAGAGRKVVFPFAYTYTAADAAAGKVSFQAKATLKTGYYDDAHPQDNTITAVTATVRPKS